MAYEAAHGLWVRALDRVSDRQLTRESVGLSLGLPHSQANHRQGHWDLRGFQGSTLLKTPFKLRTREPCLPLLPGCAPREHPSPVPQKTCMHTEPEQEAALSGGVTWCDSPTSRREQAGV